MRIDGVYIQTRQQCRLVGRNHTDFAVAARAETSDEKASAFDDPKFIGFNRDGSPNFFHVFSPQGISNPDLTCLLKFANICRMK